jgi:DNA invertase Pin-like site-specific DNA recombinase
MKVIGYSRVSTDEQASEGVSMEAQKARIEAYCVAKDWELVSLEADPGMSAKDMKRPGLQTVLDAVRSGSVEAIVIYKLDRLTRSVLDLNRIVELLDKNGVALVSMQESLDATTPTGRLMLNLLASVSQWEREIIGQRTKEVMSYMKSQGMVYCRPVYGYDTADGRLLKNTHEQKVITRVKAWRVQGMSYSHIAEALNAKGVPTKRGGQWAAMTVRNIILA